MVVYVELVLFENFAIDYIILLLSGKITKIDVKRPWLGGIIGAIYSCFAPLFNFLQSPPIIIFVLLIMIIASYYKVKTVQILQLMLTSVLVSASLFGTVYLCSKDCLKHNMFYTDDVFFYVALGGVMLATVTLRVFKPFFRETNFNEKTVILSFNGIDFEALVDTGNTLYYNNTPVILVKKEIIPENFRKPLIIPYKSVGNSGALLGFRAENIILHKGNKEATFSCVIAICENGFGKNYSALMHPDILSSVI